MRYVLNFLGFGLKLYLSKWWQVKHSYHILTTKPKDMEIVAGMIKRGHVKPIIGDVVGLSQDEFQRIRSDYQHVMDGKGGVGKLVIQAAKDSGSSY